LLLSCGEIAIEGVGGVALGHRCHPECVGRSKEEVIRSKWFLCHVCMAQDERGELGAPSASPAPSASESVEREDCSEEKDCADPRWGGVSSPEDNGLKADGKLTDVPTSDGSTEEDTSDEERTTSQKRRRRGGAVKVKREKKPNIKKRG
jgi:hypothetical protein